MASLIGTTTGTAFGATAETGILIQNFSVSNAAEKVEVKNAAGDVVLVGFHNQKVTGTIAGVIAGTTGVAAAQVGALLTGINNSYMIGGLSGITGSVTTSGVVVDTVAITQSPDKFKEISIGFTKYAGI